MDERWYSVHEIAAYPGVAWETAYCWIDRKVLPAHRIGEFRKFKVSQVDEWAHAEGDRQSEEPVDG